MKEFVQAGNYYRSLSEEEKKDLTESIASSIFFLEDDLQRDVLLLIKKVDNTLSGEIAKINNFTI